MRKTKSGQSLVELIVAMGLAVVLLPALLTGMVASREGKAQQIQRLRATAYMKEAQEAVRTVREGDNGQGWSQFAQNGIYHPTISGSTWTLAANAEVIDDYTRSIEIADVNRDDNGAIVLVGGSLDPSTKKITITVSWENPRPSSVVSAIYYTRYLDNINYIETTEADFTPGDVSGATVTNTYGGEVVLSGGGHGDWCQPDLTLATVDLPKNGVANALTVIPAEGANPGYAFAGTGDNASGVSFAKVLIQDSDPPSALVSGTYSGFKTNDIFGTSQYAYLATDNNFKEVEIINLQTDPYSEQAAFNAPGNGNGNAVYVSGGVGYMTAGSKLYAFNATTGAQIGSAFDLSGIGNKIQVVGDYIYVAVDNAAMQLEVIQISTWTRVAQAVNVNDKGATSLYVNGTQSRVYLVTANSVANPELYIIGVNSPPSGNLSSLASIDLGSMSPKGVVAVTNNKVVAVGTGGTEYQVFTYDGNSSLTTCGSGLNVDVGIHGISTVIQPSGSAYSYIITGDTTSEFKIILGGPSGSYSNSGTFTSAIFDSTAEGYSSSTAFNRYVATSLLPGGTTATYQFAIADAVSGSCSGANYIFTNANPDNTIPLNDDGSGYENPARCMRYRVTLSSSDPSSSPEFQDITINISP